MRWPFVRWGKRTNFISLGLLLGYSLGIRRVMLASSPHTRIVTRLLLGTLSLLFLEMRFVWRTEPQAFDMLAYERSL